MSLFIYETHSILKTEPNLTFHLVDNFDVLAVFVGPHVTSIGPYAFTDCTKLHTVSFTSDSMLRRIGDWAFYNTNLQNITIPRNVTHLGEYCFAVCPLNTVTFQNAVALMDADCTQFYRTSIQSIHYNFVHSYEQLSPVSKNLYHQLKLDFFESSYDQYVDLTIE